MRLINQKSLPYQVDVPYDRVWLEITDNEINAHDGIQNVKLGKYSSQENAMKAIEKLHTQLGIIVSFNSQKIRNCD
mgnify:CR=1 FL=1